MQQNSPRWRRRSAKHANAWGGLDGVIHAAGVPGNGRIAVLRGEQEIRSVLAPKMGGSWCAHAATWRSGAGFRCFDEFDQLIGSPGTCGYAAANAAFDSFVETATRPPAWKQVVAVNWAAWRETGMAANLLVPERVRAARDGFLRAGIATDAGVDAFARILGSRRRRVIMTSDDLEAPFTRGGKHAGGFLGAGKSNRTGAFERSGGVVSSGPRRSSRSASHRY